MNVVFELLAPEGDSRLSLFIQCNTVDVEAICPDSPIAIDGAPYALVDITRGAYIKGSDEPVDLVRIKRKPH